MQGRARQRHGYLLRLPSLVRRGRTPRRAARRARGVPGRGRGEGMLHRASRRLGARNQRALREGGRAGATPSRGTAGRAVRVERDSAADAFIF